MLRKASFVLAFFIASSCLFAQSLKIATFSVERLGGSPGRNYRALSQIIQRFDIVGCIGVESPVGIANIMKFMGNEWKSFVSEHSSGSGLSKEFYGYIWKNGKMRMAQSLGFYQDRENVFSIKPYGAEFETSDSDFTLVLAHLGGSASREVDELGKVYDFFVGLVSGGNVILGGNFGDASKNEFESLRGDEGLDDAVGFATRTSIGPRGLTSGEDHIFINLFTKGSLRSAGTYDYIPDLAAGSYERARETVSDHLPVYVELKLSP